MELTEQQKLEILCAYLPYGVTVMYDGIEGMIAQIYLPAGTKYGEVDYKGWFQGLKLSLEDVGPKSELSCSVDWRQVRPLLRHPEDMTEEEQATYIELWESDSNFIKCATDCLRYLHSIHIDTFGAIEGGWAVRKEVMNG